MYICYECFNAPCCVYSFHFAIRSSFKTDWKFMVNATVLRWSSTVACCLLGWSCTVFGPWSVPGKLPMVQIFSASLILPILAYRGTNSWSARSASLRFPSGICFACWGSCATGRGGDLRRSGSRQWHGQWRLPCRLIVLVWMAVGFLQRSQKAPTELASSFSLSFHTILLGFGSRVIHVSISLVASLGWRSWDRSVTSCRRRSWLSRVAHLCWWRIFLWWFHSYQLSSSNARNLYWNRCLLLQMLRTRRHCHRPAWASFSFLLTACSLHFRLDFPPFGSLLPLFLGRRALRGDETVPWLRLATGGCAAKRSRSDYPTRCIVQLHPIFAHPSSFSFSRSPYSLRPLRFGESSSWGSWRRAPSYTSITSALLSCRPSSLAGIRQT